jgi:RNA polymerase sigma-70 factor (ECF subfamily)
MNKTDEQLVIEYFSDSPESFDPLVSKYIKPIYNFLYSMSKDKEVADELTQETFLKVWKNLKKFQVDKNFKIWIYTIARNVLLDWFRKKKNINFSQLDLSEDNPFEDTLIDTEPLPPEIFERQEIAVELSAALEEISPEHRLIISLHDREDMTFEEIAEITNKPMNTVKSQYRRGIMALRKQFGL